jgi:hypothetical protein
MRLQHLFGVSRVPLPNISTSPRGQSSTEGAWTCVCQTGRNKIRSSSGPLAIRTGSSTFSHHSSGMARLWAPSESTGPMGRWAHDRAACRLFTVLPQMTRPRPHTGLSPWFQTMQVTTYTASITGTRQHGGQQLSRNALPDRDEFGTIGVGFVGPRCDKISEQRLIGIGTSLS